MTNQPTVAFIGTGNMAGAIIAGLLQNNFPATNIWASSPTAPNKKHLQNSGIHLTTNNCDAAEKADIIILSVKPNVIAKTCHELLSIVKKNIPLITSIAAGTAIRTIESALDNTQVPIVRVMPNIAATVSASATGLYANAQVTSSHKSQTETLFRSVGTVAWAKSEDQLDAMTAIAGSGPAYLFYFYEAMQNAAESLGIDSDTAKLLISEMATGASKIALESDEDFQLLRKRVTSPNGTTQAATDFMTEHNFTNIIDGAVRAAYKRAKELST